jgi:phosphatidate cytidylyltransferase
MLRQRILTAVVLAPLALFGVFGLPPSGFVYLLDLLILLSAWEWANLSGLQPRQRWLYVLAAVILIAASHVFYLLLPTDLILGTAVFFWLVAFFWVTKYPVGGGWRTPLQRMLIGVAVLLPCWVAFIELKSGANGELLILILLLLVWGADVGAYFAGKTFGRNKLAPDVSPGKTREGLYGGLLTCLVVALLFAWYLQLDIPQMALMVLLALLTGLVSVLGDLFESMLKRHRGIKDSSHLLPGHGGVLDRIDSLTAAAPVFVLGIQFIALV